LIINSAQHGAVTPITLDLAKTPEQQVFITSDLHIDSVYCNRDFLLEDLKEAVRRKAIILLIGDVFDAMQGRFDPRRSMAELRPEYRRDDYYDFVTKDVGELLAPFAKNIAVISDGNHELSVLKNANTNLADRLVERLNNNHGGNVRHGGYGGWVRFMWERNGNPKGSTRLKYFHGAGGESPQSKGALQTGRQAVYLPDANVVVNGHSHNAYWIPLTRERLSGKGELYFDTQTHLRTPGYKQGYADGSSGWEVTRGGNPKPLGGCWLKLWCGASDSPMVTATPHIHDPQPVNPVEDMYEGIVFPQE
jgi:hypothetical protein